MSGPTKKKVREGVISRGKALREKRKPRVRSKAELPEDPGPTHSKVKAEFIRRRNRGKEVVQSLAKMFSKQRKAK